MGEHRGVRGGLQGIPDRRGLGLASQKTSGAAGTPSPPGGYSIGGRAAEVIGGRGGRAARVGQRRLAAPQANGKSNRWRRAAAGRAMRFSFGIRPFPSRQRGQKNRGVLGERRIVSRSSAGAYRDAGSSAGSAWCLTAKTSLRCNILRHGTHFLSPRVCVFDPKRSS